jgi:signal transduction histidine kinase
MVVRRRIVLLAAVTALVAVVLIAIPLGVLAGGSYLRGERLELDQAAASVAARARGDAAGAPQRVDGHEIQLSVYNRARRRLSGPGPASAGTLVAAALTGRQADSTTDNAISVAVPVFNGDQVVAALLLSTSLDSVHERTAEAWLTLGAMSIAAALVSALGARVVAVRLIRPVNRLTHVAERIGTGDVSARAETSGIAELDTLAGTLNDSVQRLQDTIDHERAFSAEVSHQLRTPLSGLRLELERLQRLLFEAAADSGQDDISPTVLAAASSALAQTDRLERTITDVISLARDLSPPTRGVSLLDVLAAADQRWREPLAAKGRSLRVHADPDVPDRVAISAAAAGQILDVLLDNAMVHGRGTVTVSARSTFDAVAIEVSDGGPELTLEAHELFGKRNGPRSGIGLPFARKLADAEGARLVLASACPATFRLAVPAVHPIGVTPE